MGKTNQSQVSLHQLPLQVRASVLANMTTEKEGSRMAKRGAAPHKQQKIIVKDMLAPDGRARGSAGGALTHRRA